jgi:hypothetical protein
LSANNRFVESETADQMTDRPVAAKVQQHFTSSPANQSVFRSRKAKSAPQTTGRKHMKGPGSRSTAHPSLFATAAMMSLESETFANKAIASNAAPTKNAKPE